MEEELLYKIIFSDDSSYDPVKYGYFVGRNKKSVFKFKSALYESQINPVLINDADHENALFAKILKSETEELLKIAGEFNMKQVKLRRSNINEIKWLFGDGWVSDGNI
ncbi:MAG: hypothetical protein ABRQ25_05815 [Clostridiaceae bacterium]